MIDVSNGLEVPSQIVFIDGQRRLRIHAQNIPPVGYKVFEIRPGAGQVYPNAAKVTGNLIENSSYGLTVSDRGAITSLIDKNRGNREFVRVINGRAFNDLGPGSGTLQVENAGPVSVTLTATGNSPLNHTTRITLLRDSERIDIRNDITQNFNSVFTWGFGFEFNSPDVWHEEVGAIIKAKLLNQGGHYSPRNARYDWLTLNHFADISDGGIGVTLSNADCNFMQLGNSTAGSFDTTTPLISVLAGGQVDSASLGILNQGGDTHFLQRFALQTHDNYDQASAMRFSLEHQNPLVTGLVNGGSIFPPNNYTLLSIDNPNLLLWAIKPAEDGIGRGIITRLWNQSGKPENFSLTMTPGPIMMAQNTTHIETPISNMSILAGSMIDTLNKNQIKTFLISLNELNHKNYLPRVMGAVNKSKADSSIYYCKRH